MTQRRWLGLVAAGLLLAGCATKPDPDLSRSEFEGLRQVMASNPGARYDFQTGCESEMRGRPDDELALVGAMLDVDLADAPTAFCARFAAAVVRGDLDYADYIAFQQDGADPAALRRFVRAMRVDPSAVNT